MYPNKAKCTKSVVFPWENGEKFTEGEIYDVSFTLHRSTLHLHALNNEKSNHGIGQFSLWGLIKDSFFKEHFVFVKE